MSFDDDLTACADLVQQGDPERFRCVMAAPVTARPVLFALYAMNIEISRAPWVSKESMIAEMRLQWWREVGQEIAAGVPVRRHYVTTPLSRILTPDMGQVLDDMADARRWDIYRDPFDDEAAFDRHIDRTSGGLMWMAASSLGSADEGVVRAFAYGAGVAAWLLAIPELEANKRIPLLDGTPEGVKDLASKGLKCIKAARDQRHKVSAASGVALWTGWQAETVLKQAVRQPERVSHGALGQSEFSNRIGLMKRAVTGRW
ncbi:MAG: squalene/phytoene synthase family protein [Paracoccaceae bacterium]